jgi:polyferredoxin
MGLTSFQFRENLFCKYLCVLGVLNHVTASKKLKYHVREKFTENIISDGRSLVMVISRK